MIKLYVVSDLVKLLKDELKLDRLYNHGDHLYGYDKFDNSVEFDITSKDKVLDILSKLNINDVEFLKPDIKCWMVMYQNFNYNEHRTYKEFRYIVNEEPDIPINTYFDGNRLIKYELVLVDEKLVGYTSYCFPFMK